MQSRFAAIVFVLAAVFSSSFVHAEDDPCDVILRNAVTKFESSSVQEFNENFARVLKMDKTERDEAKKSGSAGVKAIIKLIPIGADGNFSSERMRNLSQMIRENESLVVSMLQQEYVSFEELSPKAIEEWGRCKNRGGIAVRTVGGATVNAQFIVLLEYRPRVETDPDNYIIEAVNVTSATPVENAGIQKGMQLRRFSSLQGMYKRNGREGVEVVVTFRSGHPAVRTSIPEIPDYAAIERERKRLAEDKAAQDRAKKELAKKEAERIERENAFISLYEHDTFRGREVRLSFNESPSDLKRQSQYRFGDTISSVRYQIPQRWRVVLYNDDNFRKEVKTLEGTGSISNLHHHGAGDNISSVRWEKK